MSEFGEYKLRWRGRESGPFSVEEINRRLDDHEIGMGHEVFYEQDWITVEQFLEALSAPPPAPAPWPVAAEPAAPVTPIAPPAAPTPVVRIKLSRAEEDVPVPSDARHRLVFALLAIVAGFAGLHNFYARQWLTGLLQLLLSVATYLMGFGIIASWIWAIVEAIFVHKDGNGIDMI